MVIQLELPWREGTSLNDIVIEVSDSPDSLFYLHLLILCLLSVGLTDRSDSGLSLIGRGFLFSIGLTDGRESGSLLIDRGV